MKDLEAENQWLKGLLVARSSLTPQKWRLSNHQARIFGSLLSGPKTRGQLIEAVYWDTVEPENADNCVKQQIYWANLKLKPFSVTILNHYGSGYSLDPPGKQSIVRELMTELRAPPTLRVASLPSRSSEIPLFCRGTPDA